MFMRSADASKRRFLTLTNEVFLNCFIQHSKFKRLLAFASFTAINTLPILLVFCCCWEFRIHTPRHVSHRFASSAPACSKHLVGEPSSLWLLALYCIPHIFWGPTPFEIDGKGDGWEARELDGSPWEWRCDFDSNVSESIIRVRSNEHKKHNIDVLICKNSFRFTSSAPLSPCPMLGMLLDVIYLIILIYSFVSFVRAMHLFA